jgi:hypothetical protein
MGKFIFTRILFCIMSALGQYSAVEHVNHYLRRMGQQSSSDASLILEYDRKIQDLHMWLWYDIHIDWHFIGLHKFRPIDDITKKRLLPEELEKHQETHYFQAPDCFCAILDEQVEFTKAIFLVDPKHGWTIRCAKNICGYAGRDAGSILDISR